MRVPGGQAAGSALLPGNATISDAVLNASGAGDEHAVGSMRSLLAARPNGSDDTFVNSVTDMAEQAQRIILQTAEESTVVQQLETNSGGTLAYLVLQLIVMLGNAILFASLGIGCIIFAFLHPPCPVDELEDPDSKSASICCLIPALLEHEGEIIIETVETALSVKTLQKVVLCYNTKSGDVSEILTALDKLRASDPRLEISHNPAATSKAANLNHALHLTEPYEFTCILDADHHLNSECLHRLLKELRSSPKSTVCMQGAVLVRGDGVWEAALTTLNWYFFAILFPALQMISGTAMFAGAGAVWRSDVLRAFAFTDGMVCEDDDLSMRVICSGLNIGVCPQAELTELAPESIHSFFRQRLRWSYGYEQSLNKHLGVLLCKRPRAALQRLYVYSWHVMACVWVASLITYISVHPTTSLWSGFIQPLAVMTGPSLTIIACVFVMLHNNKWKRWKTTLIMIPTAFIYGNVQAALTVWARLRMICGMEWHVTRRKISRADSGC